MDIGIPGLSRNESLVYYTLLNLKEAGATKISERAGLFRTLVYDILTKLAEKGLVTYIIKSGKRIYRASSPNRLLELIKERENETQRILPQLNSLFQKPQEECLVEQYEGINGMKAIVEDMFQSGKQKLIKEFFFFGPRGTSMEFFGPYLLEMIRRTNKLKLVEKVDFRGIWSADIKTREIISAIGKKKDHRFFPEGFNPTVPILIYGDKVVINGGITKPFTILIKNQETADSFKYYFEFMWRYAKIST